MKHRAEPKLNIYFVSHDDALIQNEGEMNNNPISKEQEKASARSTSVITLRT